MAVLNRMADVAIYSGALGFATRDKPRAFKPRGYFHNPRMQAVAGITATRACNRVDPHRSAAVIVAITCRFISKR